MALNYDSPLIDNTTGSPTLDSLKSGSDKINGALTEIKEEVNDLGSASTADVQTSTTDDTADSLMAVGAFGLGLPNIIPTGVDLNDYVTQGFYNINDVTGISNLPPGGVGSLVVLNYAAPPTVRTTQNFYSVDGSIYSRSGVVTTWTDWVRVYHTGNILGTVSETAGVPTGAIIESGSNSDGGYKRWADGTQICTGFDPVGVTTSTARDNVYFSTKSTIDFPHDFVGDIPVTAVSGTRDGISPEGSGFFWPMQSGSGSVTLTTINYGIIGTNDSVVGSYQYIAVGRWFT